MISKFLFMYIPLLCTMTSCIHTNNIIPTGIWTSEQGRPDICIEKDSSDGTYTATVFHRLRNGEVCPIVYPFEISSYGMYIVAEGKIIVIYDPNQDRLFLSPGGEYLRIKKINHIHYKMIPTYNWQKAKY